MAGVHYLTHDHRALLTTDDPFGWPGTPEGWRDRYQYLLDAYHGETYSPQLIKDLQLFRALDDNGKIIAQTRRLFRDRVFLVDVAATALAIGQVTLTPVDGAPAADVQEAMDIWARSEMTEQGDVWGKNAAIYGDLFIEPIRTSKAKPYGVELVSHDARTVLLEYDPVMGRRISRVVITHELIGEASVDPQGYATESGTMDTYQRTLNPRSITIERTRYNARNDAREAVEDEEGEAGAGKHGLGVTPVAHGRFSPSPMEPEHSLPVTHGGERAWAEIDSLASQISAVGDRFANPKLMIKGVKVGEGADLFNIGKILNLYGGSKDAMANTDAQYLEPSLAGLGQVRAQMERLIDDTRATYPEFLFAKGANLSGDALQRLETRFVAKYGDDGGVRSRIYGALEKAIAMGVALAQNRPYDPLRHPVTLSGPPLLPADTADVLKVVTDARTAGLITMEDAVQRVQEIGLADRDATPEEYVQRLDEEKAAAEPIEMGEDPDDEPTEDDDGEE